MDKIFEEERGFFSLSHSHLTKNILLSVYSGCFFLFSNICAYYWRTPVSHMCMYFVCCGLFVVAHISNESKHRTNILNVHSENISEREWRHKRDKDLSTSPFLCDSNSSCSYIQRVCKLHFTNGTLERREETTIATNERWNKNTPYTDVCVWSVCIKRMEWN